MERKNWKRKLAAYSAMTAAIVVSEPAEAQVIFTDIDPDFYYYIYNDEALQYNIDFNHDGINECQIYVTTCFWPECTAYLGYSDFSLKQYHNNQAGMYFQPQATFTSWIYDEICYRESQFVVNRLNVGDEIGDALIWGSEEILYHAGPNCGEYGSYIKTGLWDRDGEEHFIGSKFSKKGNTYFGWIRLLITSDNVIITSFAYNETPNEHVFAGLYDEVYTNTDELSNINPIIYAYNNLLAIKFLESPSVNFDLNIINSSGVCVFQTQIDKIETMQQLNVPFGIYTVILSNEIQQFRKKVFIIE
ncbi:MAG: hypothetical protein ACKVPJ_08770 [Chitinophagales bacterium]